MKICVTDRAGKEHLLDANLDEALVVSLSALNLVEATCGGCCSCATCQILVDPKWLSKLPGPLADESLLLQELLNVQPNSRLACQILMTPSLDGIHLKVAPEQ